MHRKNKQSLLISAHRRTMPKRVIKSNDDYDYGWNAKDLERYLDLRISEYENAKLSIKAGIPFKGDVEKELRQVFKLEGEQYHKALRFSGKTTSN